MHVAIVPFTRDLRARQHALAAACRAARPVVPQFVLGAGPTRRAFLAGARADLPAALCRLGDGSRDDRMLCSTSCQMPPNELLYSFETSI